MVGRRRSDMAGIKEYMIMKLLAVINPENAVEEEISKFKLRQAARAVVFDRDGRIALLNVSKKNYHKLPGGGIEAGESVLDALKRECREEIGCEIEVAGEIGEIVEYLKMFNINQTSFCYMAKLVGEKGKPAFMPGEIEDGFMVQWVEFDDAKHIFSSEEPVDKWGRMYIIPRDKAFLNAVGNVL